MMARALGVGGLCGLLSIGCSNRASGDDAGATDGATTGPGANSLVGTWDLTTTQMPSGPSMTTVTIGQNSLAVASPAFTLTAARTGDALTFTDEQTLGNPSDDVTLRATQTAATFDAGVLPFDLGGSWMIQIAPAGQSAVMTCALTVSATEIDGSCQKVASGGFDFRFTSTKLASTPSSFGDLGGAWTNNWTWPGSGGGTFPCKLDFAGNGITTCPGGAMNGTIAGSPLTGITFTYDGASMVSGAAQGWAEFVAIRR
jgi:hypothetical protein